MKTISIILGSSRKNSSGKGIATFLQNYISSYDKNIKIKTFTPIEPLNLLIEPINDIAPMRIKDVAAYDSPVVRSFSAEISLTDGFIFVVPVYNHTIPGGFKIMLDHIFHEFNGKPVAVVGYGPGSPGKAAADTTALAKKLGMNVVSETVVRMSYTEDWIAQHSEELKSAAESVLKEN